MNLGEGPNVARIWSPSSDGPVAERRFSDVDALLRWVDESEVFAFGDGGTEDGGVAVDCMPYYRAFGIERADGTRAVFGSLGELVARCMEEGLEVAHCDVGLAELRSPADFAGRLGRAAVDDPDEGRLVLYVRPAR